MVTKTSRELGYTAWRAFHRIRVTLLPPLVRHLNETAGLSEAEYQVFIGLTSAESGQMKPSDLAREMGWDFSRLSHQISRMEARGLLSRQQCPTDARSCWIGLTKQGQSLADKAIPVQLAEVHRLFTAALTKDQLHSLIEIADAIEAHLEATTLVRNPR